MNAFSLGLKFLMLAGAVSALSVTAAHAVEAADAAKRLQDLLAQQQMELSFSAANEDGNDIILRDTTVKFPESSEAVDLGDVTLSSVTEEGNGDYRVGRLFIDTILQQDDDGTVEINDITFEGLVLPRDAASDPFGGATRYDSMEVKSVEIDLDDQDFLWMENLTSKASVTADGAIESTAGVASFTLKLSAIDNDEDDDEFVDTLQEIDYDELSGRVEMAGKWSASDGRLTVDQFDVQVDDVGTMRFTADLAGYTTEFIKSLRELMPQDGDSTDASAQGMAALGLMQQLTFHGLSFRFDDDSFTSRMLNHAADKKGVAPAKLIDETRAGIQAQLAPFAGDAFAKSTAQAVATFLSDPENIEIAAKPAAPVPFFMLGAALMGAPATLVTQLGLRVTANQ